MLRNIVLVYSIVVTGIYAWATWTGHQIGNDESSGWSSAGPNQHHK